LFSLGFLHDFGALTGLDAAFYGAAPFRPGGQPAGGISGAGMTDGGSPRDDFDARLERARAQREGETPAARPAPGSRPPMGIGFRIGVDVAAALAVGIGIGYLLDSWLGTKPWLLVVFFFLGAGAGILNVYRAVMGMGYAVGYRPSKSDGTPTPKSGGEPPPESH
jgi:ATP synthase protein I